MNLQFFAEESADDTVVPDINIDTALDGADPEAEDTTPPEVPEDEVPPVPPEPKQKPVDKAGNAFAQMRVENAQSKALLAKVAQAAGIEFTDEADLIAKLNSDALTKLAEKQHVPVELLTRMEQLELDSKAYAEEKLQVAALQGFQTLKDSYSLTDEELQGFAAELDENGKNPFQEPIDVISEYKLTHYDEIMQKKIDAAVQAALKTSNAADTHSSTPGNSKGKGGNGTEKVTTVQSLDKFLDNM